MARLVIEDCPESYIKNCFFSLRDGDTAFSAGDKGALFYGVGNADVSVIIVRLDGYAIIPREEYDRLKALDDTAVS
jgi:hypothetical protein